MDLNPSVVSAASDLGLTVAVMVDSPGIGLYESVRVLAKGASVLDPEHEPDLRAALQLDYETCEASKVVALVALTENGRAFCDLVRSGDLG